MVRKASSKPDTGSSSTATIGFEAQFHSFGIRHCFAALTPAGQHALRDAGCLALLGSAFRISSAWMQRFIHSIRRSLGGGGHLAPQPAVRDSAIHQREASPQVVSEAKDNMAGVDFVCLRFAPAVLANGSMSSNQSGEGDRISTTYPLCA